MDTFIERVNTASMVIGYPVLLVVVLLTGWFGTRIFRDLAKIFREMRYDRWKRMKVEKDWDNIEASWMLELDEDYENPVIPEPRSAYYRHHTLEFPESFSEELYNYQEERYERP
jgi:hypothetical protein